MRAEVRRGERVHLRRPGAADREAFLAAAHRSHRLHHPWVAPPSTDEAFAEYLSRVRRRTQESLLVCRNADGALVGVFNLSEIVRGPFRSAFLGYYAFRPFAGKGYMGEALELTVAHAFEDLDLHRVEANVQPANVRSAELLRRHGFRVEGFPARYLQIDGEWRDHVRFTRLREGEAPPFGAHRPVTLHEVDSANWREVADLSVRPGQRKWVADVSTYLALCALEGRWRPLAIRADGRTVGFVMWARDPADGSDWIGGFLIDRREQGKGYGRAALAAVIGGVRALPGCRQVALSYRPDNAVARSLYASAGFVETGDTEGDEVVARLGVRRGRRT